MKLENEKDIGIFVIVTREYVNGFKTMLNSLVKNTKITECADINVIYSSSTHSTILTDKDKESIDSVYPVNAYIDIKNNKYRNIEIDRVADKIKLFKLEVFNIENDYKKIIILDSDLLFLSDPFDFINNDKFDVAGKSNSLNKSNSIVYKDVWRNLDFSFVVFNNSFLKNHKSIYKEILDNHINKIQKNPKIEFILNTYFRKRFGSVRLIELPLDYNRGLMNCKSGCYPATTKVLHFGGNNLFSQKPWMCDDKNPKWKNDSFKIWKTLSV